MTYEAYIVEECVCVAHMLCLPYQSKCNQLHGHNYKVAVKIIGQKLNPFGMLIDFVHVKNAIKKYDHCFIGKMPNISDAPTFDMSVAANVLKDYLHVSKVAEHIDPSTAEKFAEVLFQEINELLLHQIDYTDDINLCPKLVFVEVSETPSTCIRVHR